MTVTRTASQEIIAEATAWPKKVWRNLREQGRIVQHPVFPDSEGPAARRIEDAADVRVVIELLRLNYERLMARHG